MFRKTQLFQKYFKYLWTSKREYAIFYLKIILNDDNEVYYMTNNYSIIEKLSNIRYVDGNFYCIVDDYLMIYLIRLNLVNLYLVMVLMI